MPEQTDAILELKLYRLAQLEIEIIRKELKEKRREAERCERYWAAKRPLEAHSRRAVGDKKRIRRSAAHGDQR